MYLSAANDSQYNNKRLTSDSQYNNTMGTKAQAERKNVLKKTVTCAQGI